MTETLQMFIGQPVLIVIDIQRGYGMSAEEMGITLMNGSSQMISRAERIVEAARAADVPIVFFQEAHRPDGVDFGRELDGDEGPHCVEGDAGHRVLADTAPRAG